MSPKVIEEEMGGARRLVVPKANNEPFLFTEWFKEPRAVGAAKRNIVKMIPGAEIVPRPGARVRASAAPTPTGTAVARKPGRPRRKPIS